MFVGGRTWDDLYDFTALRRLSFSYPWLDVIPVVESESETSGAEIGTLADVVTRYGAWSDHDVLVCGSPAMIRSTVSRMLVAGTPWGERDETGGHGLGSAARRRRRTEPGVGAGRLSQRMRAAEELCSPWEEATNTPHSLLFTTPTTISHPPFPFLSLFS